ncbi:hypothetical protein F5B20DRAFT_552050 [Whalleya microplaca]|nr:hypothetical protein F5B20DRAFT_552050 [Whalleya microplaca]
MDFLQMPLLLITILVAAAGLLAFVIISNPGLRGQASLHFLAGLRLFALGVGWLVVAAIIVPVFLLHHVDKN